MQDNTTDIPTRNVDNIKGGYFKQITTQSTPIPSLNI